MDELLPDGRTDSDYAALISGYDPTAGDSARRTCDALAPVIRWVAARVTAGRTDWRRHDFLADVVADLLAPSDGPPLIRRYDETRGSFIGWLFTVVRNMWLSRTRRKDHCVTSVPFDDGRRGDDRPDWSAVERSFGRPFSPLELSIIDRWDTRERVEVTCMAGLEHRVPPDRWDRYLREYESATRQTLPRPFPPDEVARMSSPGTRTRLLASLFGIAKPNTLSKRWERGSCRLLELPSVCELFAGGNDSNGEAR